MRITNSWKADNKYIYLFRAFFRTFNDIRNGDVEHTNEVIKRFQVALRMIERSMSKITRKDEKRNSWV